MNPREVAEILHENERKLLRVLQEYGNVTAEKLSQETGLSKDAVEKASGWAETKGVASFKEEVSQVFELTEEGREYAINGLPEQNLRETLKCGARDINELKKSFNNLNIALVWVRRKGWVEIKGGVIKLTPDGMNPGKVPEEEILEKLYTSAPVDADVFTDGQLKIIHEMVRRNLVKRVEKVERYVGITEFGEKVLPLLDEIAAKKVITQITPEILVTEEWKEARFQRYDIRLPAPSLNPGKRHFISQVIDYIRRFWVELGFKEMKGEYLELNFWNFDALYQPQDHPARDLADTFYMQTPYRGRLPDSEMVERVKLTHESGWTTGSTGWQYKWDPEFAARTVLRTHTTSLSVNQIAELRPEDLPGKFFSVGRVFRNETIDWNHLAEFYQTDGIVIGEGVTFRNMKGYLKAYLEGLGLERFRFRPGYFPYTEMSMEAEVWIEDKGEWMELFGAGMFRPEVVKPLIGIDVPVLAWGPGFDRLVMQSYNVANIRELYSNDIGLLRDAKLWME